MGGAQEVEIDRRSEPTGAGKERLLDGRENEEKKRGGCYKYNKMFQSN